VLFVSIIIPSNERLLNCDALRAFLRPGLNISYLNEFQYMLNINVFPRFQKEIFHLI